MKRVVFILKGGGFVNHYVEDEKINESIQTVVDYLQSQSRWIIYPDCAFRLGDVQGFYVRNTEENEMKIQLETQKKIADAATKMAESMTEGDDWKKPKEE